VPVSVVSLALVQLLPLADNTLEVEPTMA